MTKSPLQNVWKKNTTIIAVASGKGGVGKSTIALNLALGLSRTGKTIGLLDADIYGPSVPLLQGATHGQVQIKDGLLQPFHRQGLWCLSMGDLLPEHTATVWRGPMVIKAIKQLLFQAAWPTLDGLVIDMPPGTGDVPLTIAQTVFLSGIVIVTMPEPLAQADARKAIDMFHRVHVPIIGYIENMYQYTCPHCHKPSKPFGDLSGLHDIPLLAQVPLCKSLQLQGSTEHTSTVSECFDRIAQKVWTQCLS